MTTEQIIRAMSLPGYQRREGMVYRDCSGSTYTLAGVESDGNDFWLPSYEEKIRRSHTVGVVVAIAESVIDLSDCSNTGHLLWMLGSPASIVYREGGDCYAGSSMRNALGDSVNEAIILLALELGEWPGGLK